MDEQNLANPSVLSDEAMNSSKGGEGYEYVPGYRQHSGKSRSVCWY